MAALSQDVRDILKTPAIEGACWRGNGPGGVPTDGFQEDALRYGWPGTLTQSVELGCVKGETLEGWMSSRSSGSPRR